MRQLRLAVKKSEVLSDPVSVRARLQVQLAPLGVQAPRDRTELWHRFFVRKGSLHGGATSAVGEIQRTRQANQEDPWQFFGPAAATAVDECASSGGKGEQRDSGRPWLAVTATLKRLWWTIHEKDPFLWCMHDGRRGPKGHMPAQYAHASNKQPKLGSGGAVLRPCTARSPAHV